jgi:hypothetical protein
MIILNSLSFSLTPEAYAQIIAAMATTLVVVLTLGLRLIDDAWNRYENFARPRISALKVQLDTGATKSELEGCHLFNLPSRRKGLAKSSRMLVRHGRFFLTKLYPQESLDKILGIYHHLERFLALVDELKPYWEPTDFDSFLEFLIRGGTEESNGAFAEWAFLGKGREARVRLEREKPQLIGQIRTLREKILLEIKDALEGLNSFLEAK